MSKKLSGLGRGLGALIPQRPASAPASAQPQAATAVREDDGVVRGTGVLNVPISAISANPEQPRAVFRHQELEDLMNSIREHGIIQPLTVSARPGGGYELIAGERRFRAAKMLGLSTVPVTVRNNADSKDKLVLALIENIQREDLNPMEEARAYDRLMGEFGLTQEIVAQKVGKARSTVANMLRLLGLPEEIRDAIAAGVVPAGSARAMLALPDDASRIAFFRKLVAGHLSTRDVEAGVRRENGVAAKKDPAILGAEETLRNALGTRVEIKKRGGKGAFIVSFYSDEEYGELLRRLSQ
ncbi:MAG TPA: ParB/RepB/Spo0J family partition protein [Candidatus Binatia bacterium]|nr:ParB/RepB/Spo0J family partition protein [Candidatus Binatia bacterium]